jgi:hypothetical protein
LYLPFQGPAGNYSRLGAASTASAIYEIAPVPRDNCKSANQAPSVAMRAPYFLDWHQAEKVTRQNNRETQVEALIQKAKEQQQVPHVSGRYVRHLLFSFNGRNSR